MPDDRVPAVRFAPVRRRVPIRPDQGAAMTAYLIVAGVIAWAIVALVAVILCRAAGEADRRDEILRDRARAHQRGKGTR